MNNFEVLTVNSILSRPIFKDCNVATGHVGLYREIGWVHILDIPTAAPYITENAFILTTGIGLQQSTDRINYLTELIHQGASGLCVALGGFLPNLPKEMVDLAIQHDFPIITLPEPVRFIDITQDIHSIIINKQHHFLKELELFLRNLQHLSLQSNKIQPILQTLHTQTAHPVFYYSLKEKDIFYPALPLAAQHKIRELFNRYITDEMDFTHEECVVISCEEEGTLLIHPIICNGQLSSYIGLFTSGEKLNNQLSMFLQYAGKAIAHILLRKQTYIKMKKKQSNIIHDILQDNLTKEEQARFQLGIAYNRDHYFTAGIFEIQHKHDAAIQKHLSFIKYLLDNHGLQYVSLIKHNRLYVLVYVESYQSSHNKEKAKLSKIINHLQDSMMNEDDLSLFIGFGQTKSSILEAKHSFREAEDTLDINRTFLTSSPFYEDTGIYQFIKGIQDEALLTHFIRSHLGNLLSFDEKSNLDLLQTLDEYLKCRGSKQETAKKLYIHRQTLYHRLQKLEELLGEDFLLPEKRICLEIALHSYHLMEHRKKELISV